MAEKKKPTAASKPKAKTAQKAAPKKVPLKKPVPKNAAAKKEVSTKTAPKKPVAAKPATKKPVAKKVVSAKTVPVAKAQPKKVAPKKPVPKKVEPKKAETKKPAAKPSVKKKAAPVKPKLFSKRNLPFIIAYLLASTGVVLGTNFAWQIWGQNFFSANSQSQVANELWNQWSDNPAALYPPGFVPTLSPKPAKYEAFANLFVPKLGADWVRSVGEGTELRQVLDKMGVGHYPSTALPGELGNFAVAAHRTTYGASFADIDQLKKGDWVYLETKDGWYSYQVSAKKIVKPNEVYVLEPDGTDSGKAPKDRILTMTTCHPKNYAYQRLIVVAKFVSFTSHALQPPKALKHFYSKNGVTF